VKGMSDLDEAVRLFEEAGEMAEAGEYQKAEETAGQALTMFESGGEECRADVVNVLCSMTVFAAEGSRFAESLRYGERAVSLWRDVRAELDEELERLLGMEALGGAGNAMRELGRYEEAERLLREALALAESGTGEAEDVARFANNLGVVYKYSGRFDEGAAMYGRALA
jgi:tetratricopeptide (TPR) repeat protein